MLLKSAATNLGPTLAQRLTPSIERSFGILDATSQGIRVAMPAIVVDFDPATATVTVQPATMEYIGGNQNGPDDPIAIGIQPVDLPQLTDVPVLIPGAGGWSLTFPIQAGDECLLIFSDTAIDSWFQSGGSDNTPISIRRHSLSDAIAVFGLRSTPRFLSGYSASSTQLRNDDASVVIDLAPGQVTVTSPNVTVNASGDVTVNASGDVDVVATGTASVQADKVDITGSSSVTIDGANQTSIDARTFLQHKHFGVSTGSGLSGGVV